MSDIKVKQAHLVKKTSRFNLLAKDFARNKHLYLMIFPVILFYLLFMYFPMYGTVIAFQDYMPGNGFFDGPWVGLKQFQEFFSGYYFWRVIRNTVMISVTTLVFEFPAPIILALMMNEIRKEKFKKVVQSITYLPHFISMVVICGIIIDFTRDSGIINTILGYAGFHKVTMLQIPKYFLPIYVSSEIWQKSGWGSIIYLAALTNVDPQLYEAAQIEGAGKWKQIVNVTIPGIMPTIVVMFILRMGQMLSVGFEKIILLYNPVIYEKADVISTFVYRSAMQDMNYSFSAAVDLFNAVINITLLIFANWFSKKITTNSLW